LPSRPTPSEARCPAPGACPGSCRLRRGPRGPRARRRSRQSPSFTGTTPTPSSRAPWWRGTAKQAFTSRHRLLSMGGVARGHNFGRQSVPIRNGARSSIPAETSAQNWSRKPRNAPGATSPNKIFEARPRRLRESDCRPEPCEHSQHARDSIRLSACSSLHPPPRSSLSRRVLAKTRTPKRAEDRLGNKIMPKPAAKPTVTRRG
jgi:hypothetical protein